MSQYSEILDKVEDAFDALLGALIAGSVAAVSSQVFTNLNGLTRFKGMSASELTESRIEIVAEESTEADETNNQNVMLKTRVITNCQASAGGEANIRALHKKRTAQLGDVMARDDLAAQLTTLGTDVKVQAATGLAQRRRVEGKNLVSEFEVSLLVMGAAS